jgi:hypothetical protein
MLIILLSFSKVVQSSVLCIASFADFAYRAPLNNRDYMSQVHLPAWEAVSQVPILETSSASYPFMLPQIVRLTESGQEIWVRVTEIPVGATSSDYFAVFNINLSTWRIIPALIETNGPSASDLFLVQNQIIARTDWASRRGSEFSLDQTIPVIARFDDSINRFYYISEAPEINIIAGHPESSPVLITAASPDSLYIFNANEHIMRYVPAENEFTQLPRADESMLPVVSATTFGQNRLVYEVYSSPLTAPYFRLHENVLFEMDLVTDQIRTIESPANWPIHSRILFDISGRLWLGATGYRETDGQWVLIHEEAAAFLERVDGGGYSYVWGPAILIKQSSDGRLWYTRYQDTSGWVDGTAWFDPDTQTGCQFTNRFGSVVEDNEARIWFVADGILYREPT